MQDRHEVFVCHASSVLKCSVLPNGAISGKSFPNKNFRQDCSFTSKEKCTPEWRNKRNPFRAKFPTRLQLYEQRKMQDTKRSYVMRAPFGNAAYSRMTRHQSAAQQGKSFQIRLSRRASRDHLQAPLLLLCDFLFFVRTRINRHVTRLSIDRTRA